MRRTRVPNTGEQERKEDLPTMPRKAMTLEDLKLFALGVAGCAGAALAALAIAISARPLLRRRRLSRHTHGRTK